MVAVSISTTSTSQNIINIISISGLVPILVMLFKCFFQLIPFPFNVALQTLCYLFQDPLQWKPKSYPNGSMMVFIPFSKGTHSSAEYWAKILFNHENFMGDQMAISIGGLNNLNNLIKPKSLNQKIPSVGLVPRS